jgi:hypothetical protein
VCQLHRDTGCGTTNVWSLAPSSACTVLRADPGNDSRYVKYVQDMPISWFESFIRSLAHGQIELHRALPKAESLKDCKCYYVRAVVRSGMWLCAM